MNLVVFSPYEAQPYNITRWREDINFMFEWQEQNLKSKCSEWVRWYHFFSCHFFISLSQRVMLFLEKFRGESKAQSVYVNCNSAPGKSCPVNHMKFLFSLWHFWNFRAPYAEQFSVGLPYLSPSFNGHLAKSGSRVMQRRKLKWRHQDMENTPLQSRM